MVFERDEAIMRGIADEMTHRALSPLDELRVFIHYKGEDDGILASRVGRSAAYVRQRRKILSLPQSIVDRILSRDLTVSQGAGLTYFADESEETITEWADKAKDYRWNGDDLRRQRVKSHADFSSSPYAKLVSVEEYQAAGGEVQSDLFSQTFIAEDVDLLRRLYVEKYIENAIADNPGYADYVVIDKPSWDFKYSDYLPGFSESETPADVKAMLEVHIYTGSQMDVKLGVMPMDVKLGVMPKDKTALIEAGLIDAPKTAATSGDVVEEKDDPLEVPQAHQKRISLIRTHALRQELIKTPKLVVEEYLVHQAERYNYWFVPTPDYNYFPDDTLDLKDSAQWTKGVELSKTKPNAVRKLKPAEQQHLLAYRMLLSLTTQHPKANEIDATTIRKYFTPDADFLRKYKKPQLLHMIENANINGTERMEKAKTGDLIDLLIKHVAPKKDWLPLGF